MAEQVRDELASATPTAVSEDSVVDVFGADLESLAATLSNKERAMLAHIFFRAMDPIDRVKFAAPDLLSAKDEAILATIETR